MAILKNDFIELAFTARSDGKIFDTTNIEEAKEIGIEMEVKPLIISVGNQMVLRGFEEALSNKEIGKTYTIHLTPEKAFGKRNPQLIKTFSLSSFKKNNIHPYPGQTVQLDTTIARVVAVTGGRVLVDFNNPLSGKDIDYEFTVLRKIEDNKEKVNALQDYFFRKRFDFELHHKKVIFKDKVVQLFLDMLGEKFKEMTGLEFSVDENKGEKENLINENKFKDKPVEKNNQH